MARTKISEFSATAADNTDIDNIDIAEGCAPSGINNAIRELMAQLKDFQTGAAGDAFNGNVNATTVDTTNLEVSNLKAKDGTAAGSIADSTGVVTLTSVTGTTADYTNLEVTNLKAKDGTAAGSIADSTGVVTLNSAVLTTADINGGTLDNATIGGATAAPGTFTTLASNSLTVGGDAISPQTGFRNRIINGGMTIDQRNAGAAVNTSSGSSVYTVDRWLAGYTQTSKFTVQQNAGGVTPPAGFTNYLGVTSSSAYSVLTGDAFWIDQRIEGFNVADLGWGTTNAQAVTLSFWVRSSLTGSFGGSVFNSGASRSYSFSYSISSANTWERKTVTIPGDTSGTWLKNNGQGILLNFSLGVGSTFSGTAGAWAGSALYSATGATSVVGTNGATFYITGVQLEKGSTATSFDVRDFGRELILCQRYYQLFQFGYSDVISSPNTRYAISSFVAEMRSSPTLTGSSAVGTESNVSSVTLGSATVRGARFDVVPTTNASVLVNRLAGLSSEL